MKVWRWRLGRGRWGAKRPWRQPLGILLRHFREARGLTQYELADILGCYQHHLSRWENGGRVPRPETLARLSAALGVPVAAFWDVEHARIVVERQRQRGGSRRKVPPPLYLKPALSMGEARSLRSPGGTPAPAPELPPARMWDQVLNGHDRPQPRRRLLTRAPMGARTRRWRVR